MNKNGKCPYFSNPSATCNLNQDVCELLHCDTRNYRKDCFIYGVRRVYLKQQARNERLVANVRAFSLETLKEA